MPISNAPSPVTGLTEAEIDALTILVANGYRTLLNNNIPARLTTISHRDALRVLEEVRLKIINLRNNAEF